jgi:ribose-phosphate pyrophosphokinase
MPSTFNPVKLFAGSASSELAANIGQQFGKPLGDVTVSRFSDGELQPNFNESVRGCDIFLIQSTYAPSDNLMELLLMIDAARRASAHYICAVIPYFGYARQDRKDKPRVSIGSKMIANLLSAGGANRVMTMDLHAPQIQGFFDVPVDHLDASVIFGPYIQQLGLSELMIASPDVGGTNRARKYAKSLHTDIVICDKQRKRANSVEGMALIGNVEGKNVVIVDDIIDTAGTLTRAAQLMMDKGALSVRACITHPVLSGKAYETLDKSVLTELVVCDTIPLQQEHPKIKVLPVAGLFANAIQTVYEHGSISTLFQVSDSFQPTLNL